MGVSGSGKTTVAELLAERLHGTLVEGDDLHPQANREKMRSGEPLTDDDRWPWLDRVAQAVAATDGPVVATCSALKRSYRDRLREGAPGTFFVHLDGESQLLKDRQASREGHFMPPSLMDSQLETLEQLAADEAGVRLDVAAPPEELADLAARAQDGSQRYWDGAEWTAHHPAAPPTGPATPFATAPYPVAPYSAAPHGAPPYGIAPYAVAPKNPGLALVASFFIPGLGTIINGEVGKGVGILVGYVVSLFLIFALIGVPLVIGLWIWGMVDAYQGAQRWNAAHGIRS
ncbi:hypothetical protein LUZ63_020664 [Rhynchospora breviuscula]|uniref:Gluconokinase n=1 Tax=Rhynchospora breviuscula TaxID=2022672 RepID=A0A9Q0BZH5_9POAL|nr:hypothetical protein LUZ63_020664 [Rhynchospora breviuscula]